MASAFGVAAKASQAGAPGWRRTALALLVLSLLLALCAPFFTDQIAHDSPQARAGVIDFSRWGPLEAPVELKGEWKLTWLSQPPKGVAPPNSAVAGVTVPIQMPGSWNRGRPGGVVFPEQGAGLYHLTLRGLKPGHYVLLAPKIFGASAVSLDGREMSRHGRLGLNAATSTDVVLNHKVAFDADGRDIDLGLSLSNFHFNSAGYQEPLVLGLADPMDRWDALEWASSLLMVAALLLLACYDAVVFVFRPSDRASLYLGLGCLAFLPFVALQCHDNLVSIVAPGLSATAIMATQYVTSSLALALVLAYTRELFPKESPRWILRGLIALMGLRIVGYAVTGALGDTVLMTHLSAWSTSIRVLALVYILAVVVTAVVRGRNGAVVFLVGLGGFVSALIWSDLSTHGVLPRPLSLHLVPIGVLLLIFSQMVILAERWSEAIAAEAQTNADLRRLLDINISISSEMRLDALLRKIVQATSSVIHADRSSLFLHDPKSDELWSAVAEGVDERQIRFPSDRGLAGWVFTEGQPLNLADAYDDPRFNSAVDAETGYRTHSVLTQPVTARDGRKLGVMQALNRRDGPVFGRAEEDRMAAFAAQAAVAIENATLFTEVQTERNYNESILRSMSSGVLTLDPGLEFAKLNVAAQRILEAPEGFDGAAVRAWLAAAGLLPEVEAVAGGGEPKTLLDADIQTVGGRPLSANLSIVSLIGEQGPTGLLVLVEDITEGKRLQGVMRRFMTQKVVDQVLGREDDVLFGSAARASVLFADIRNFTALAEALEPRQTVEMLNEVFTELFEAVSASDGLLDKFIGDAIMAVYGAPISSSRDPQNAVDSAVAMVRAVELLNQGRRGRGLPNLSLGIGIATGDVVAGAIGSPRRMDYTVIGDSVNLASRLEAITKVYKAGVVVCEATAAAVQGLHPLRELDTIRVRGRKRPERIFEVVADPVRAASLGLAAYAEGRELLAKRRWGDAAEAFARAAAIDPNDWASQLMLERARTLVERPPPRDWDGVWDSVS